MEAINMSDTYNPFRFINALSVASSWPDDGNNGDYDGDVDDSQGATSGDDDSSSTSNRGSGR